MDFRSPPSVPGSLTGLPECMLLPCQSISFNLHVTNSAEEGVRERFSWKKEDANSEEAVRVIIEVDGTRMNPEVADALVTETGRFFLTSFTCRAMTSA